MSIAPNTPIAARAAMSHSALGANAALVGPGHQIDDHVVEPPDVFEKHRSNQIVKDEWRKFWLSMWDAPRPTVPLERLILAVVTLRAPY